MTATSSYVFKANLSVLFRPPPDLRSFTKSASNTPAVIPVDGRTHLSYPSTIELERTALTSLQNDFVKHLVKLREDTKYRNESVFYFEFIAFPHLFAFLALILCVHHILLTSFFFIPNYLEKGGYRWEKDSVGGFQDS